MQEIISEKTYFDGTNHIDTGIKLFAEDRDFVLAIDYRFLTGCASGGVLAECYQESGKNGFRLSNGTSIGFKWGDAEASLTSIDNREIVVIRHIKGDRNLYIYNSKLDGNIVEAVTLERTKDTNISYSLVFGSAQPTIGSYKYNATGYIYWAKIWYTDLGDDVCKKLALWTREDVTFEACGLNRYYLNVGEDVLCSFSLLATNLLSKKKPIGANQVTKGGWGSTSLNTYLNDRFLNSIPDAIRALIKQVKILSSAGDMSTDTVSSPCYVTIPSLAEMASEYKDTMPYSDEGKPFNCVTDSTSRIRKYEDGTAGKYWLRSPNASNSSYFWAMSATGSTSGFQQNSESNGVLPLISM